MSKRVIAVLVFFLIIIGLLGGYGFNLNKEMVALTELQEDTNLQSGACKIVLISWIRMWHLSKRRYKTKLAP